MNQYDDRANQYKVEDADEGDSPPGENVAVSNAKSQQPMTKGYDGAYEGPNGCRVFLIKWRFFNPFTGIDDVLPRFLRAFVFAGQWWLGFCVSGLIIYNETFNTVSENGVVLEMDPGYIAVIILICFLVARIYIFIPEGMTRLSNKDMMKRFMRAIVVFLILAAIGISHYYVFWGVNRMAWSEVRNWGYAFIGFMIIETFIWDPISMIVHYYWAKKVVNEYGSQQGHWRDIWVSRPVLLEFK